MWLTSRIHPTKEYIILEKGDELLEGGI